MDKGVYNMTCRSDNMREIECVLRTEAAKRCDFLLEK